MHFPEESIAKEFYIQLQKQFLQGEDLLLKPSNPIHPRVVICMRGEGSHWNCDIEKQNRKCSVACFHYEFKYKKGPEYYIQFMEDQNMLATGRISDNKRALEVIQAWMDGQNLEYVYRNFSFVDEQKRKFQNIHATLLEANEAFMKCEVHFDQRWGDIYNYSLKKNDRSIQYYVDPYKNLPKENFGFTFLWDDCPVFYACHIDLNKLISVMYEWLINQKFPSTLKSLFPWIELYSIAGFYERGEGIMGEFIESWNQVEAFYSQIELNLKDKILNFIKAIRAKGFDKSVRAGTSMYSLILSRSRRHGLRKNQSCIIFSFKDNGISMDVDGRKRIVFKDIFLSDEILKQIQLLNEEQIT